jgi:hypothetical protein
LNEPRAIERRQRVLGREHALANTGSGDLSYTAFGQDFEIKNLITAQMRVGRDKFDGVQREAGHGIKHFIAAHEFIHVCGLDNSEHTIYGPDADLFIRQPQPFSGPFSRPDEDRFVLHIPTGSKPSVISPPIFLKTAIADKIRDNWA